MNQDSRSKLFIASCFALVTTSMAFSIRAGILDALGKNFELSATELGYINSMAFLGFPIAMMVGGYLYNTFGPKKIMFAAFFAHLLGILLTIFAGGFWSLLLSTFFIGFGNGMVEAACNPLVASLYPEKKTAMLNRFHVWFPGGIVLGSLIVEGMKAVNLGWQAQVAVMLIPTVVYGYLAFSNTFPALNSDNNASTMKNFGALLSPLFFFMAIVMTITATTELGTQQWIEKLLKASSVPPLMVLALITGLMALGRFFAGPVVHRFNPVGVLWGSSFFAVAGIGLMSVATTSSVMIIAAILFAIGVCYFWPTMVGFVAEYMPETGALGMSLVGGAGMFGLSLWQPVIGGWLDSAKKAALATGVTDEQADLLAGQATLDNLAFFPAALIVLFGGLYFYMKGKNKPAH